MERIAFLIEDTHERLPCLLNPDSLVLRRVAGVRPRQLPAGPLTGAALRDDPLLYTGGGRTELELELLFDVSLAGATFRGDDVRQLTGPLWELAENHGDRGRGRPPLVRLIWGKAWNVPGVVVAVSERLEHFGPGGVPRRSWLRMRLWRVQEPARLPGGGADALAAPARALQSATEPEGERVHELLGSPADAQPAALAEAAGLEDIASETSLLDQACREEVEAVAAYAQSELVPAAQDLRARMAEAEALEPGGSFARIGQALDRVEAAVADLVREIARSAPAGLVEAARVISGAVDGLARDVGAALDTMSSAMDRAGASLRATFGALAEAVRAGVTRFGDRARVAAARLSEAPVRIARAVTRQATALIAAASTHLAAGARAIESAVTSAMHGIPLATVRVLRETAALAVTAVRELAAGARVAVLERLPDALGPIYRELDGLARAGMVAAARMIGDAVMDMARAARNGMAGVRAMSAVLAHGAAGRVDGAVARIREALDQPAAGPRAGGERAGAQPDARPAGPLELPAAVQAALAAVEEAATAVAATPGVLPARAPGTAPAAPVATPAGAAPVVPVATPAGTAPMATPAGAAPGAPVATPAGTAPGAPAATPAGATPSAPAGAAPAAATPAGPSTPPDPDEPDELELLEDVELIELATPEAAGAVAPEAAAEVAPAGERAAPPAGTRTAEAVSTNTDPPPAEDSGAIPAEAVPARVLEIVDLLRALLASSAPESREHARRALVDITAAAAAWRRPGEEAATRLVAAAAAAHRAQGHTVAPTERLDQLAYRYYGDPACWRLLAQHNHIDDPLRVPPGSALRIPPLRAP